MSDAIPLPDILDGDCCETTSKLLRGRRYHLSSCTVAADFTRGESAGGQARYAQSQAATEAGPPADESDAYKAGWERGNNIIMGQSYNSITWMRPWEIRCSVNIQVEVDPALFIASRLADYVDFEPNEYDFDWEKPIHFFSHLIEEDQQMGASTFGGLGRVSEDRTEIDWSDYQLRRNGYTEGLSSDWTEQDTLDLHQALGLNPAGTGPAAPPDPTLFDAPS